MNIGRAGAAFEAIDPGRQRVKPDQRNAFIEFFEPLRTAAAVPNVMVLDIRLSGTDAIALARLLQRLNPRPQISFMTTVDAPAAPTFEVPATDNQCELSDDPRFELVLRRVQRVPGFAVGSASGQIQQGDSRTQSSAADHYLQRLVIRSAGRVQLVEVARIDWLSAAGNYVEIHAGKESLLHRERLRVLERQLDPADFVRIHRSTIVNRTAVKELRPLLSGDFRVLLRNDEPLRLSRTYRAALDAFTRDRPTPHKEDVRHVVLDRAFGDEQHAADLDVARRDTARMRDERNK